MGSSWGFALLRCFADRLRRVFQTCYRGDMDAKAARADARRRKWRGGVARSFDEMATRDLDFWLAMAPEERLKMVWSLVEEALALKGDDGPPPRLQRSVGGVRPLRG